MALSSATVRRLRATESLATQVVSGSTVYHGSFLALGAAYHATSGKRGYVYPYNDEDGAIWWGLSKGGGGSGTSQSQDSVTGDGTSDEMIAGIMESFIVANDSVTGVTAATDVGRYVYLSDDDTPTLTRPTVGCPLGVVVAHRTSTYCDVMYFSVETVIAIVAGGCAQHTLNLGTWLCSAMTNGNILTGFPAPHQGQILSFFAIINQAPAGTGGTVTLNLEIGGTNVGTSGTDTVVVETGDALGAKKASAAISANNVFHEGELIDVEAASTTAMSSGMFTLFMEYLSGPGI